MLIHFLTNVLFIAVRIIPYHLTIIITPRRSPSQDLGQNKRILIQ